MSEYVGDTPMLGRRVCPACEPDADPSREILDVMWCEPHTPGRAGLDDALAPVWAYPSGGAEAGGEDNRRYCDLFHRGAG